MPERPKRFKKFGNIIIHLDSIKMTRLKQYEGLSDMFFVYFDSGLVYPFDCDDPDTNCLRKWLESETKGENERE